MDVTRRKALKAGGGAGLLALLAAAGALRPGASHAADWNKQAFEQKSLAEALRALGAQAPSNSDAILIKAPEIAENGAVVPIAIESKLPGTQSITLLIENNPQPLAASFGIPEGTEASVTTRVKMGQSSDVYALVQAGGRYYVAKKEIKITLGGCGG
jgi:sulfur-oxidizing protein SoxY